MRRDRLRIVAPLLLLVLHVLGAAAPAAAQPRFPPDSSVHAILDGVVRDGRTVGLVVGLLEADGTRRVFARGSAGAGARPLDGESVFEIGSITKVFTGALLADMVRRREVRLSEPVARLLPRGVRVPSRHGKEITLLDLATHRSGLPGMPDNIPESEGRDPFARYTAEALYEFLSRYELPRDPGASAEYSNLGMGLLGHALALRAGTSYEELVRERLIAPLNMARTGIALTPGMDQHRVRGHDRGGFPEADLSWMTLHGAGALRSTVDDLLTFARANLSADTLGVHDALRDALRVYRPAGGAGEGSGLSWGIFRGGRSLLAAHSGETHGYTSYIALDLTTRRAVVVLTNSYSAAVGGLDVHLLDPSLPLPKPPVWVAVVAAYRSGGVRAAVQRYLTLRETARGAWQFDVSGLETAGEWMLWRGFVDDAAAIFQLNAASYPRAPEPRISLGDAHSQAGRLNEAVASYRSGLALAEAARHPRLSEYRSRLQGALQGLTPRQ